MKTIKVLIIDDEPGTVDMLRAFLELFDMQTQGALTGEDGLEAIEKEKPDVLLLDLMLPDIDGYEICRRLRARPETADLPVVMLSARTSKADVRRGYAVGATRYLKKPVDLNRLLEIVQALGREARHRPPPAEQQEEDAARPPTGLSRRTSRARPRREETDKAPPEEKKSAPYPPGWKPKKGETPPIPGQYIRDQLKEKGGSPEKDEDNG